MGMQWHIRGKSHDNDAMAKAVEAALLDLDREAQLVEYYTIQNLAIDRIIAGDFTYEDFCRLAREKPDFPVTNFVSFLAKAQLCSSL